MGCTPGTVDKLCVKVFVSISIVSTLGQYGIVFVSISIVNTLGQ